MAEAEAHWNFLGVEIREPLVDAANKIAEEKELGNLYYTFCNAMLWLEKLLSEIPAERLQTVTIQFPDPWFKKKHAKRRMVNEEMVETIAKHLSPKGRIFIQTDIEFLAEEMFELFRANHAFEELKIKENPFFIKTERENAVEDKGLDVYRTLFISSSSPS